VRIAVIGAGWAGLAAAVAARRRGHAPTLFEAARTLGGRARSLAVPLPGGGTALLDNGQHILVGAYVETLRLMEDVGVAPGDVLLRLPLVLRHPDGSGIALPDWPAPWDAAAGILGARGWGWKDKLSLLRASQAWQRARFRCDAALTVAQLTANLTPRVRADLVDPLCVSALNTPAERSSAQVFLRVIGDALFGRGHGGWGGSNLLLPKQDLGQVFPDRAQAWLAAQGAQLRIGRRVEPLCRDDGRWEVDGEAFDAVVLACPPTEAARLVAAGGVDAPGWLASTQALAFEAIATVYVTGGPRLPLPLLALRSGPAAPAQFVFDRSQLGGPRGVLAFVVSASPTEKDALERAVLAQAATLGWAVQPLKTVVEKRATFACTPGLQRPPMAIAPGLWACGDYVEGPYPATLEGAVRSGLAVAGLLHGQAGGDALGAGTPAGRAKR
jgi:squalene-associated FAD-dependent desaturase